MANSGLRDATITLYSLLLSGFTEEAIAWRNWLLRAVAGDPADLQIMYGIAGERRLAEANWRSDGIVKPQAGRSSSTFPPAC